MFHTHTAHNHVQQDNRIVCEKENVKNIKKLIINKKYHLQKHL